MNKPKALILVLLLNFSLLGISCATATNGEAHQGDLSLASDSIDVVNTSINAQTELNIPTLELSASQTASLNKPFKIHWKVENLSRKPIFIYSTLLDESNSTFAELKINKLQKSLEIDFTRLSKLALEPNYFPKTKFSKVEPGKSLEGDFNTRTNLLQEMTSAIAEDNSAKSGRKGFAGQWKISASIAYGDEIESVQRSIDNTKGGHPINPIVEWQKLASSKAIEVTFE